MTPTASSVRLLRPEGGPPWSAVDIVGAVPVALTAGFESRADARVRQVAWDLAERWSSLLPVEATCTIRSSARPGSHTQAGVVLLDRHFPIWLVVLDECVVLSVATELLDGRVRDRFEAARAYLERLVDLGYVLMLDPRTGEVADAVDRLPCLVADLARGGDTGRFESLKRDSRLGFIAAALAVMVLDQAGNVARSVPRSFLTSLVHGFALGTVLAGLQHFFARRVLSERLDQIRRAILGDDPVAGERRYSLARWWVWLQGGSTAFIGVLGVASLAAQVPLGIIVFGGVFLGGVASIVLGRRAFVVLDDHGIEGLGLRGRARIAYCDVEDARERVLTDFLVLTTSEKRIWISKHLHRYGELAEILAARLHRRDTAPCIFDVDGTALTRLRAGLDDVRRRHVFGLERDIARSPLWMVLRTRRHPLRRQYRRQRHLLRHGSLVWGYVLVAHDSLFEAPLDQPLLDAPAVVVFDSIGGDIPDLARAAERIGSAVFNPDPAAPLDGSLVAWFNGCMDSPLSTAVPHDLSDGRPMRCSRLMVVRKHLPLRCLRSPWIPLLVDPGASDCCIILPRRYWDAATRRAWQTGAAPAEQSGAKV
jgi:hypothetical protein